MGSRRQFLAQMILFGAPTSFVALAPGAQARRRQQTTPQPAKDDDPNAPNPDPKKLLESNQKDMKKDVEKLYELASELKKEVEKTDSIQVLSLSMLKKTEEIERLAKEIRNRAKG